MSSNNYNPDILTCIANLSNDEVFTPPSLVNEILDQLPNELWVDKTVTFLDPVSKSGVFLREIAKRLMVGLEAEIPDQQERINHIYTKQLFGIAITELTSLLSRRSVYCSKIANGKYSVCTEFTDEQGNIKYEKTQHTWKAGKCEFCGAGQVVYDRDDSLETHAYQFIHTNEPYNLFNMKFDVIIGNPPYQLETSGYGRQAKPIYHLFVRQAKKLNPRYLAMILPSRWFTGGMGLKEFREEMINDSRIRKIIDFENSSIVFPGVDIAGGVCYFVWDRDNKGLCEVTSRYDSEQVTYTRQLNEFSVFVRSSKAVPIIRKVLSKNKHFLSSTVSSRKPFGIPTNYKPQKSGVTCWFTQKVGLGYVNSSDIDDKSALQDRWKLLIPKAPIAGQTDFSKPVGFYYDGNVKIAKPGEVCTESWIVAAAFNTEEQVISFKSYLFTKVVRFLLLQTVVSQDVGRQNYIFVPDLIRYEGVYTDEMLVEKWGITPEEWEYINSKIK